MTSTDNRTLTLAYGRETFSLDIGARPAARVLLPSPPPALSPKAFAEALARGLDAPIQSQPLAEIARNARSCCIVVSDKTRNYRQDLMVPALLDALNSAGMPDDSVTALIGNGTHGAHSAEEKLELLGAGVTDRVRVADHHADDPAAMADLGATPAGTQIRLNRIFMDADLKIVTGGVTHHYYAGFTGGRKGVMPGVAARQSIVHNHSLVLAPGGGIHPGAAIGVLDGNPVHEDMLAAARAAGPVFLVNVVTDGAGVPAAVFAGGLEAAHAAAVELARNSYEIQLDKQYDLVIASCGGHPKDIEFYQAHKSYNNAFQAVRPGGSLILLAACPRGLGPEGFAQWFALGDIAAIEARIRSQYHVPGQTAMATLRKSQAVDTILVSGLPDEQVLSMKMRPARTLEQALAMAPADPASTAVMPRAALTVPKYDSNRCV